MLTFFHNKFIIFRLHCLSIFFILSDSFPLFTSMFDISLLNSQHYKVCIKGKVEQSKERSSTLPYTLV